MKETRRSGKTNRKQGGLGDALFGTRLGEVSKGLAEPAPANPIAEPKTGADLFIVDNSDTSWKVQKYLHDWADIANSFDIATGYFEIGALLALDGQWQKLQSLRILMGDEVSRRTKKALLEGVATVTEILDKSIESEKEENDFMLGVPAIVEAIKSKQIQCRIYTKDKFHAKAYITHAKQAVVGSAALVGSSNFTVPGLTTNVELNIQLRREVEILQEWYERHWDQAEEISDEILKVIERHTKEYLPFDIYAKSLQEFFRGHEMTAGEWEKTKSRVYPVLDQYQKEGYQALLKIAGQFRGAFLCDGVGLGKTLVGLMVIERLIYDRKRVLLLVPKATREPVWDVHLRRYLPHLQGDYSNLAVYNHTDLLRGGQYPERLMRLKEMADVIIIDEGHHFRNPGVQGKTGYWKLFDICEGKQVIFLTATPINNSLRDLQHMIELFSRKQTDYFGSAPLGIHSLAGHFNRLEDDLEKTIEDSQKVKTKGITVTDQEEAQRVLFNDNLFRALVIQRSRAYVKKSQEQHDGAKVIFPKREPPQVVPYNLKKVYGGLLTMVEKAFAREKPLFSLAMYYPLAYPKEPLDTGKEETAFLINRQKQLVRLIRILFLKRFESSALAFEMSCCELLRKMLVFVEKHAKTEGDKRRLERWKDQNAELIAYVHAKRRELMEQEPDEENEDFVTPEMLEDIRELEPDRYDVPQIINETYLDMEEVVRFLTELKKFKPVNDDKLKALVKLLNTDSALKTQKVIIFSEFLVTARYLKRELEKAGIPGLDEVDSATDENRGNVIARFSPYYNGLSSGELKKTGISETRVLISTDVLSEGLNLQDATRLINYDLHWNPVRLMQRIGRVDRRLNPEIENKIIADNPAQKVVRGTACYWNFLPPDELDNLLHLYSTVSGKTLKISKVFGIEGKKLLTETDDYDALKDFNHEYEGTLSVAEEIHLEYQKLLQNNPDLEEHLNTLPGRVFSGKDHPKPSSKAAFFCYALPGLKKSANPDETVEWTEEVGGVQWYLYDIAKGKVTEDLEEIVKLIRSTPETPRHCAIEQPTLKEIRRKLEQHIKNTYLKRVQAPVGVKPTLKAWMELS